MKVEDMKFPMHVIWTNPGNLESPEHEYTLTENVKDANAVDGTWHPRQDNAHDQKTLKLTGTHFYAIYQKQQILRLIERGIIRVL